jgi:queuine tRNA-ribosyltransferase
MPVGTQGAVKGVTHRDLESLGAEILLSNTYHSVSAARRRSDRAPRRAAPLHRLDEPILTDSGGYQVFSLAARRTIDEQGAHFKSHLDGSAHLLTPEKATDIQAQLGSDIAMVLDECLAHPSGERRRARSMRDAALGVPRARAVSRAARRARAGVTSPTRPGAVRHRAGQRLSRAARRERAADRRRSASRPTRSAA